MSIKGLDEIRATYPPQKADIERRKTPWLYYVIRPLSFYVTWWVQRTHLTADQITWIGIILGLLGCSVLAFAHSSAVAVLGAVLVNVSMVLDCVDGTLARLNGTESRYGALIDALGAYLVPPLIFLSAALGARSEITTFFFRDNAFILASDWVLLLGSWSSIAYLMAKLIQLRTRVEVPLAGSEFVNGRVSPGLTKNNRIKLFLYQVVAALTNLVLPLLLIASCIRLLGALTIVYSIVNSATLVFSLTYAVYSAGKAKQSGLW